MTLASPMTELWRTRLAARQATLLGRLRQLTSQTFNPVDIDATMRILAPAASRWISAAQAASYVDTLEYLTHFLQSHTGQRFLLDGNPDGLIGVDAVGRPLQDLVSMGGSMYKTRAGLGWSTSANFNGLLNYMGQIASTEPWRAANNTVTRQARSSRHFTGRYRRILEPRACKWCRTIADRGYTQAGVNFDAHTSCNCVGEAEPYYGG
jgi:hypothetical protein